MGELFFILGRGRSGTTLLSRMLLAHPDVVVAPEGFFAMSLERRYGSGPWHARRIEAFCRDLLGEARMRQWRIDVAALRAELRARTVARGGVLDYAEVCGVVYAAYAAGIGRSGVSRLGDKNPHYALFASRIARTFPAARFLHLTRDPRDNVCSYRNVGFDLDGVDALAYRWRLYHEAIARAARAEPERFLHLRYEDLLAAPQRELSRLCGFLGVDFDARMLRFHEADPREFYGERSRRITALQAPLDPCRAGRWRHELSPAQARRIGALCGPLACELGYDLHVAPGRAFVDAPRRVLGHLVGWGSVVAERSFFEAPAPLRSRFLNGYRRATGRA